MIRATAGTRPGSAASFLSGDETMHLLGQAISNAGATDPEKTRDPLKGINTTGARAAPL